MTSSLSRAIFRAAMPAALLAAFLGAAGDAGAASRRAQAAIDAITARMSAAEARYRDAVVRIANADPQAQAQADAALADMEDAVAECTRTAGCPVSTLVASYARLLKEAADGGSDFVAGDGIDPDDADPDHAGVGTASPAQAGLLATGVPTAARASSLLDVHSHRFDDMVPYNPAVQAAIRRWLTDMRGQLLDTHENYEYLRPLMWPSFQRAGLPEALLFGIMAKESNGKVHAGSRAGAAGPMQFMYATGKRFGLGQDATGFDTRYDPRAAAEASAAYLNERMAELDGNLELALAAYNGGEGRARRVYQGSGGLGFWDAPVYAQFPAETRDYVPMVIAAAWLFLHPKRYGLSFRDVDARSATLLLQKPDSLYGLTICLGDYGTRDGYLRTLRNLNPRLQASAMLPAGTQVNASARIAGLYERYCVQGPRATLAQSLVASDARAAIVEVASTAPAPQPAVAPAKAPEQRPKHYQVQRGETLSSIARKFQCAAGDLAKGNQIKAPAYRIRPGQRLSLEACRQ